MDHKMKTITFEELEDRFKELVDLAEAGEEFLIVRPGRPTIKLCPYVEQDQPASPQS